MGKIRFFAEFFRMMLFRGNRGGGFFAFFPSLSFGYLCVCISLFFLPLVLKKIHMYTKK